MASDEGRVKPLKDYLTEIRDLQRRMDELKHEKDLLLADAVRDHHPHELNETVIVEDKWFRTYHGKAMKVVKRQLKQAYGGRFEWATEGRLINKDGRPGMRKYKLDRLIEEE